MSELPDEELIILITGGARRIAAGYDILPEGNPTLASDLTVKVLDANAGTVEFIDTATGTSLANRTLDSEGKATARGASSRNFLIIALATSSLVRVAVICAPWMLRR